MGSETVAATLLKSLLACFFVSRSLRRRPRQMIARIVRRAPRRRPGKKPARTAGAGNLLVCVDWRGGWVVEVWGEAVVEGELVWVEEVEAVEDKEVFFVVEDVEEDLLVEEAEELDADCMIHWPF